MCWRGLGRVMRQTAPQVDTVNLDDSSVREQIAATAAHFVSDLGFGGVIYDIEPILNNNPRYIDLLEETRADLPSGAILSTIGQKWAPNAHVADFLRSQGKADAWWTTYYYADVAAHVDQIVPLIYNSAMPTARAYEIFVQQETEHILDAVRSARHPPQVLIGLPTYPGKDSFWFHDTAENMSTGLSGVIAGLNSNRDTSAFTGVAIYRYFFTSQPGLVDLSLCLAGGVAISCRLRPALPAPGRRLLQRGRHAGCRRADRESRPLQQRFRQARGS